MTISVAVLDVAASGTDSAVFPEQTVHSLSVENLTALPLRIRVVGAVGSQALRLVIEAGPMPILKMPPRETAPQN